MTWLSFLSNVSAVAQISANVIVMFYVFPAYRQTRQRAFMMIWSACLIGTFDTLWDHTLARSPMAHSDLVALRTLRQLTHFVVLALETAGIVLLVQRSLRFLPPKLSDPPPDAEPR